MQKVFPSDTEISAMKNASNYPVLYSRHYSTRIWSIHHTIGSSPTFAGTECNRAYLIKCQFHTNSWSSAYAGAYRDYKNLTEQFISLVRGDLDNTKFVYVSNDTNGWWPAKDISTKLQAWHLQIQN